MPISFVGTIAYAYDNEICHCIFLKGIFCSVISTQITKS